MNFFPTSPIGLNTVTFNWNVVIVSYDVGVLKYYISDRTQFFSVLWIAAVYFVLRGRKIYTGPVAYVRKNI